MNSYKRPSPIVLSIVLLWLVAFLYKFIICLYSESNQRADLICSLNWRDGFILILCYTVVQIFILFFKIHKVWIRILFTFLLYSLAYSLIALPYFISSFFQPFLVNTFFHAMIAIILIESIVIYYELKNA